MTEPRYDVKKAKDGSFFWTLVGGNGETLATSETYTRASDAERGARDALKGGGGVKLTICVNFHQGLEPGGGSTMLCREMEMPGPAMPAIGDYIEITPESEDVGAWDAEVTRRYFHGDGSVELHVTAFERDSAQMLRVHGYREPGMQDESIDPEPPNPQA